MTHKENLILRLTYEGWHPYKPAHKVGVRYLQSLKGVRSLNKYFRESDEWWVSPDGEIKHIFQIETDLIAQH